ncbi:unnamed protein product [Effrenium voratum]|nr:unnamed protein product [Effrenium voratum]
MEPWPAELFPARSPQVVHSCADFLRAVSVESHLERAVHFPQGLRKFALEPCWPSEPEQCARLFSGGSVTEILDALDPEKVQGNLEGIDPESRVQQDVLELAERRGLLPCGEADAAAKRWFQDPEVGAESSELQCAVSARARLARKAAAAKALGSTAQALYLCELRPIQAPKRAPFSALRELDVLWAHEEGFFVGGPGTGKGLHVDQRPESNIGKQWRGRKLFAAWPTTGLDVLESCYGEVFCGPLLAKHRAALERASQLLVLEPGDLFLFNGQMPHAALCVEGELNVTSYEGILTLHPDHLQQFLSVTGSFQGPWRQLAEEWEQELLQRLLELREARKSTEEPVLKAISLVQHRLGLNIPAKRPRFVDLMYGDFFDRNEKPYVQATDPQKTQVTFEEVLEDTSVFSPGFDDDV